MRYRCRPRAEDIEARRRAAMNVLGAVLLAVSIGIPFALHFLSMKP
jgi:hypothetical protein